MDSNFKYKPPIYTRFGNQYRKIERHEVIKKGAMTSFYGSELQPIANPETIGQTPNDFSDEREFYNPYIPSKLEFSIGLHKTLNKFPQILRYWRPRGLLLPHNAKQNGGQIYKWLWFVFYFKRGN